MDSDTMRHIQALADSLEALRIAHAAYAVASDTDRAGPVLWQVLDAVIGTLNANDALRALVGDGQ